MSAAAYPRRGSVAAGFAALSRWRLVVLLTFASILLGGLAAAPLGPAVRDAFTGTLAGDHIAKNDPVLAPADVFDFMKAKAPAVAGWERATLWAGLLGVLLQIFFAGGIVETVGRLGPLSPSEFWAGSRRHFGHNLKCFALFGVLLGVPLVLWLSIAGLAVEKIFEHAPPNAPGRTAAQIVTAAVALWIFGTLTLLYDFARAARRSAPEIGAWRAYRQARSRLRGRWLRGLGILLFWTVVALAGIAAVFSLAWGQRTPSGGAVALNLLLLLLFLAVRPVARVGAWGSVLALYDGSEPPPAPVPAVEYPVRPLPPPDAPLPISPIAEFAPITGEAPLPVEAPGESTEIFRPDGAMPRDPADET